MLNVLLLSNNDNSPKEQQVMTTNTTLAQQLTTCDICGEEYPSARRSLGYMTCLSCGDQQAASSRSKWCIVPMHKQAYTIITNREDLKHLGQKPR